MRFGTLAFLSLGLLLAIVSTIVPRRWRLVVWTLIILAGVVPWGSWVGHSHWSRVEWIPFSQIVRPRDLFLNLALYAPVGYFIAAGPADRSSRRWVWLALAYGLALSAATELSQVFSHGRFPAMTDVTMNVSGTVVGALLALGRHRRSGARCS